MTKINSKKKKKTVTRVYLTDSICKDDWHYFDNYCYSEVAACDNWDNSDRACRRKQADLPSIRNQEENVFVQSLHGGEHSWLGLNDISSEGNFVWSDKSKSKFRRWAEGQPNNYGNEDCVHTLGFLKNHHYGWNDVTVLIVTDLPAREFSALKNMKYHIANFYLTGHRGNCAVTVMLH